MKVVVEGGPDVQGVPLSIQQPYGLYQIVGGVNDLHTSWKVGDTLLAFGARFLNLQAGTWMTNPVTSFSNANIRIVPLKGTVTLSND